MLTKERIEQTTKEEPFPEWKRQVMENANRGLWNFKPNDKKRKPIKRRGYISER